MRRLSKNGSREERGVAAGVFKVASEFSRDFEEVGSGETGEMASFVHGRWLCGRLQRLLRRGEVAFEELSRFVGHGLQARWIIMQVLPQRR